MAKLKVKFVSVDYAIQMYKKLQGMKQREMDVKAYTKEFYKLIIRESHMEDDVEKVARYLIGLRFNFQDELSLENPRIVEECFQLAIRVEEKLKRRKEKQTRGRGSNSKGRGTFSNPR